MPLWPFRRKELEPRTAEELRDRLIKAAGSGSRKQLRALCDRFQNQVAANVGFMSKVPEEIRSDPVAVNNYVQHLGAVAQCLARDCGSSELWDSLCGTPDTNPLVRFDRWFGELPQRMSRLEHAALVAEARQLIDESKQLEGHAARQVESLFHGRLGELLFHSGHIAEAVEPFSTSLRLCRELNDVNGQRVHLKNLLEAYRYLGNVGEAVRVAEDAIALSTEHGVDCSDLRKQVDRIRRGEPLCRIVCIRDGSELELDEVSSLPDGRYDFEFRRNRLSLQAATALVNRGKELASSGQIADALENFSLASEVDPHDPDPLYQSGMCLLELGAYGKAGEAFSEVERLAPGWFHCRSCKWLAESLESGTVGDCEFRLLRTLEANGVTSGDAKAVGRQAVADYPQFAPFRLFLGDVYNREGDKHAAVECYREGLELVSEPDLESRLLCALAGALPAASPERPNLVKRATALKGNVVAKAMAMFIPVK